MTEVEKTPVYFADPEMSDVCLVVGDKEFHVHKMTIACRSKYFKDLLYSDSKEKEEKRIKVEADPLSFQRMLELIYNGRFSDSEFIHCSYQFWGFKNDFWNGANALWDLLDRFGCSHGKELFVELIKSSLCPEVVEYINQKNTRKVYRCYGCADRFIFAAKHGFKFPMCSPSAITGWIQKNPDIPADIPDLKTIFSKVSL